MTPLAALIIGSVILTVCCALVIATAPLIMRFERWLDGIESRSECLTGRCRGPGCWCGGSD